MSEERIRKTKPAELFGNDLDFRESFPTSHATDDEDDKTLGAASNKYLLLPGNGESVHPAVIHLGLPQDRHKNKQFALELAQQTRTREISASAAKKGSRSTSTTHLQLLVEPKQTASITETLLKLWKANRRTNRIKTRRETAEQINRRMRMKFLPRVEAMTPWETIGIHNFHVDFDPAKLKPRRRKRYEFKLLPSVAGKDMVRIMMVGGISIKYIIF